MMRYSTEVRKAHWIHIPRVTTKPQYIIKV